MNGFHTPNQRDSHQVLQDEKDRMRQRIQKALDYLGSGELKGSLYTKIHNKDFERAQDELRLALEGK